MAKSPQNGRNQLDFSEAAARKAAFSETIQHPLTLWPSALGVVTGFGMFLLTTVSLPVEITIAAGGVIIGAANWAARFYGGRDTYMQKHYAKLHDEFEDMKKAKSDQLARDLKKLGCKQGQEQVDQFEDKFQNLIEVFRRVLSEGELTFSRFTGTAEQVYRSGLDNLDRIVTLLINSKDIDRKAIESRITELKEKPSRTPAEQKKLLALTDQAGVYDQTQQEVEELLARNEEALAAMDKAGAAAVRIKDRTSSQTPQETMAEAMELLGRMTARANASASPSIVLPQDVRQST